MRSIQQRLKRRLGLRRDRAMQEDRALPRNEGRLRGRKLNRFPTPGSRRQAAYARPLTAWKRSSGMTTEVTRSPNLSPTFTASP
jgi:hypothetical protein